VRRAIAVIDVETVRLATDDCHPGASLTEGFGRNLTGRAVGGIQHHMQAVKTMRYGGQKVSDVTGRAVHQGSDPPHVRSDGPVPGLIHLGLDRILEIVGQLVAATGEELQAVVRHRVVRRREHGTEICAAVGDEEGDGRSGKHSGIHDIDASRCQTRNGCGGKELTRRPRVPPHDSPRSVALDTADLAQHVGCGDGQVKGELGSQILVRQTANAIGAEESSGHVMNLP